MQKFSFLVSLTICFLAIGCDLCNAQRISRAFGRNCPNCRVTQIATAAPITTTTTEPVIVEQTTQQIVETTQSFRPTTSVSSSCTGPGCGAGPIRGIRSRVSRGREDRWTPFRNVFGRAPERIQSRSARRSRELNCVTGMCFN